MDAAPNPPSSNLQSSSDVEGGACSAIAALLHFALLATFGWMVVQGYYLHQSFTDVFGHNRKENSILMFAKLAYGTYIAVLHGHCRRCCCKPTQSVLISFPPRTATPWV